MATYSKVLTGGLANNQYRLNLEVRQKSQNVANNTSVVGVKVYITKLSGSGYRSGYKSSWSINIGGHTASGTFNSYSFQNGVTLLDLFTGGTVSASERDFTITHNADGSKAVSSSATFTDGSPQTIGSGTASGSLTLTTIPRASSFGTISGNTMGSEMTIAINRASSSFTHSMWYSFGSVSWATVGAGLTTSASFTPPLTLASQVPNATSGTMTLILRTYNGSTQIGGDVTKTVTIYVPSYVVPTISSISASEHTVTIGAYIQNRNGARVSINGAAGSYGSTISSYSITGNNQTLSGQANNFSVFTVTGNVTFTGTITDSRGRTASKSVTVNVLPNSPSTISTNITDKNFGDTFTITTTNTSSSYWYEVVYTNPEGFNTWYSGAKQTTSWTISIPSGEVGTVPNANSGTGRVSITTYFKKSDGSYYSIGTTAKPFTIHVPQSMQPTVGTLSWSETVTSVSSIIGAGYYVQGLSKPKLTLTSNGTAGSVGSTIRSITMTGNGLNGSGTALTHTFPSPIAFRDTQTYTVTVTDTRGRSASKQISLTSIPYAKPSINLTAFNTTRTTSTGTPVWDGTTTKTSWSVSVSSIKPSTVELNKLKVSVHAMERGASSYTHKYDTGSTLLSVINHNSSALTATYEKTKAYSIRLTVQDVFEQSSQAIILLPTAELTLDLGKNNMGVGKVWEKGTIDAIGQVYQNDGIEALNGYAGTLPAGDINTGAYWRNLKNGMYMKIDSVAQTGQLSAWAHVFVYGSGNNDSYEKTVIWKGKADGSIWHSGTNSNTEAMSWKRLMDSENYLSYILARDGTDYDRINGTTTWLRTPTAGLIPYGNGSGSLGSSSWRFSGLHTNSANVYGNAAITGSLTVGGSRALTEADIASGNAIGGIYGKIPRIGADGVMETGQYIDFHASGTNVDYTARLSTDGANQLQIFSNGRILTTGNVNYVVEAGSNYRKWSNGLMEQWGVAVQNLPNGYGFAWGTLRYTAYQSINPPIAFVGAPTSFTVTGTTVVGAQGWQGSFGIPTSTTLGQFYFVRPTATTENTVINWYWEAKGRWK